jgi:hypothetical protein
VLSVVFVCLWSMLDISRNRLQPTYKWQATVAADSNFWLVCVDEDLGVTGWTTSSFTCDDPVVGPSHGFFVNQFDR